MSFTKDDLGHITTQIDEDTKVGHLVTNLCGYMGPYKGPDHESPGMCTDCVLAVMKHMETMKGELDMYQALMFPPEEVKRDGGDS
jgi:hypothetical protein